MNERKLTIETKSPAETEALGERIGRAVEEGVVIALIGDLGAGKTQLTKGIAVGLDVPGLIHSPTFNLIHEHAGRLPIYHFDLYRLNSPHDLDDLGAESYFYGEGVSVVEWAERAGDRLPADRLEIRIAADDEHRIFDITATGDESSKSLSRIQYPASRIKK